jgi:hypothetical protein
MSTALAISERVAMFCEHVLAGHDPEKAARLAGYKSPAATARALLSHPQVRRALREGAEGFLLADLAPVALSVMRDILTDQNPRAVAVRAKLAVAVYDRATRAGDAAQEARTLDVTPRVAPA